MGPSENVPCTVVLVRPQIAANVGAVARVMRNMGLNRLVLVRPEADIADPRAYLLATHSEDILDQAFLVSEIEEAVADCGLVAATSSRTGGLFRKQSVGTPEEIMPLLVEAAATRPVALVFGPEDSGLSNDEVSRFPYLIHIPTAGEHPALNLAQAVGICLYEWRRCWLRRQESGKLPEQISSYREQHEMFAQLRDALEKIHFLYGPKADSLMHALRHLIGRAQPSRMEVKLLLGLARQIRWFQEHAGEAGR